MSRNLASGDLSGKALLVTPVSADSRRPLLLVPFGPRVTPLQIAEAASGLCELLWLLDESVLEDASTSRLLRKAGTVVNIAGLSSEETVSVLRAYSPDGVAGYRDADIVPLSFVAAELGLDYHTPEVARRLVDKLRQREALRNAGLPTPLCWEVPADRSPPRSKPSPRRCNSRQCSNRALPAAASTQHPLLTPAISSARLPRFHRRPGARPGCSSSSIFRASR